MDWYEWIDLKRLSGLSRKEIPSQLHDFSGETVVASLVAETGVNPGSGGIFNTTSMRPSCGGVGKPYLETIIATQPEFRGIYRNRRFYAAYPEPLRVAWQAYKARVFSEQAERAQKNQPKATRAAFDKRVTTNPTSGDWHGP